MSLVKQAIIEKEEFSYVPNENEKLNSNNKTKINQFDFEDEHHLENQTDNNICQDSKLSERDEWTNKIEYMLSVIGYVIDLGNCIRFPYVTYKNGGGAFLIPYFVFLILIGVPMMYLEMSIGQYFRVGNISLWSKVNPYMKGIGYASLLVVSYITLYYTTIIAYSVYYLLASFRSELPWSNCQNEWNTNDCLLRISNKIANSNHNNSKFVMLDNKTAVSPAEEYFNRHMLGIHRSQGIDDLGSIKLDVAICLAIVYILMYVCICKGVKSTGKAVYVTAVLPYIILIILLIHGLTLKGSMNGIYYFIVPSFTKLTDFDCWKDAAIQIFFTLGPGISNFN
jgi:SNF family Na+-dependent transporter